MSAPILSYRPQIEVWIDSVNYTKNLGDVGSVQIHKNLYAPAGEAHIIFPDMPTAIRDSIYGEIQSMARLEIKMRRWKDGEPTVGDWVVVLRGFVRSIGRGEQVGGDGRVQRQVMIVGQDCGAPFIINQIHPIISYQNSGIALPPAYAWLKDFEIHKIPYKAKDFIWELAKNSSKDIMESHDWTFTPVLSVEKGYVLPHMSMTSEGSVWQELKHYEDFPWNEVFVREGTDAPEFVYRPTPWRTINDDPLPDADPGPFRDIYIRDVVSLQAHRDDAELVNHVWVQSQNLAVNGSAILYAGKKGGIINTDTMIQMGNRRVETLTTFHSPTAKKSFNNPEGVQQEVNISLGEWVQQRLNWAMDAGSQIHEFERGSLTIKGRPEIRVGDYVTVHRGEILWDGYVVSVSHDFQPYRRYLTTIEYIRGNQWVRRKKIMAPWDKERKQQSPS